MRLQGVELHLQHHHAQGAAVGGVQPARQIKAGAAAACAQGVELALTVAHGVDEIGPKIITDADETRGGAPVAGRQRQPLRVQNIDDGGAGLTRQSLQLAIDRLGRLVGGPREQRRHIRVFGQDDGDGALFLQLAA